MKKAVASLISALTGFFSGTTTAVHGPLGQSLPDFQKRSELFGFFNFVQTGRDQKPDSGVVTRFKPSGPAFHELVTLEITTNRREIITEIRLVLRRTFIDDPKTIIYAADLTKSVLGMFGTPQESDPLGQLAREISARALQRSALPMLTRGAPASPPAEASEGFRVFAGQIRRAAVLNGTRSVEAALMNEMDSQPPVFDLTLTAP